MNWKIAGTVLAKELRETLRDRRTLIIMIVVPAFLYPALFVLMEQLALFGQRSLQQDVARVAVVGRPPAETPLREEGSLRLLTGGGDAWRRLRVGEVEAVVAFHVEDHGGFRTANARIFYDGSRDRSNRARGLVQDQLGEWRDTLLARRLESRGLPRTFAQPVVVSDSSVATPRQLGGYALGRFLPMILILMTVLGAFYPAIDLAAGEKERGTLEPLLTVPVGEDEIVAGKFAAVTAIALGAATLNLASMLLTFQAGIFQFTRSANLRFDLPAGAVALIFATLALLAFFFASLFLGIAVRSHSFKEAQNALTPVYIVSFLPAVLAAIPGIDFTNALAVIPIAGVALLFRALVTGTADFVPVLLAVGSTLVYALVALAFAVRAFGREDVLFGEGAATRDTSPLAERLRGWRSAATGVPSTRAALLLVAGVGLLTFYVGLVLQTSLGERGLLLSQWLLVGLPAVLFAWLGPWDFRSTLALSRPTPRGLAAALLMIAGAMPIGWMLAWLQSLVMEVPPEFLQALEGLLTAGDARRLTWLVLLIAVTPALCEELVFRGVLLQALGNDGRTWRAVVVSALVFGAFHLSFQTVIRFVPTAWLGLVLAVVVWRTRSIYASMLMHFVNNGFTVLFVSTAAVQSMLLTPSGRPHLGILMAAPLLLAAGFRLLPGPAAVAPNDAGIGGDDERPDVVRPLVELEGATE